MGIQWQAWGTAVRVEVTEPGALRSARRIVAGCVADAERAADVDRHRAQVYRVVRAGGRPVRIGATLCALVAVALDVAERTDGAVDPTVGAATVPLRRALGRPGGAIRVRPIVPPCAAYPYTAPRPAPGWHSIGWSEHRLAVPATVSLDLTATAKARTARLAATRVAERLGVGAMVEIGGDVATAGPQPRSGWVVAPCHAGGTRFEVPAGSALAACRADGLVDPLTGRPVTGPWRAVVVAAGDVVAAKAAAVRALLRGGDDVDRRSAGSSHLMFLPREGRRSPASA